MPHPHSCSASLSFHIEKKNSGQPCGYLGNPNLNPETAHIVSANFDWHSADRSRGLKATPFYTYVNDYIDAQRCFRSGAMMSALCIGPSNDTVRGQFVDLQYVNETAVLYGIDLSGYLPLGQTTLGAFGLKGLMNYTKGENRDTHDELYNIMPLNAKLALTHALGPWDNAMEVVMVDARRAGSARLNTQRPEISGVAAV